MPHACICTVSARQDDERCVPCDVQVCEYVSSAAEQQLFLRHLPRSRHSVSSHCQPLQPTALTSISHFIMSHHKSRRLAGSALLGVSWRFSAISMVGNLDVHRSQRCSQALLAGIARRFRSVGSHMQPSMAFSRRRWRSHGVGKATPSQYVNYRIFNNIIRKDIYSFS